MARSHIIEHYQTIGLLFIRGTRLHSNLKVFSLQIVHKPDRSWVAWDFYLHLTTLSVVDNFGSSFGLFSDISSQICVDSLWNCFWKRSDVLPCSTTQLFPKRETAVISIACITGQKYLQQGDKFQRCYCSSVWFTATLYQVLSEHNQTLQP